MKQLFRYADKYLEESDWKILAMIKFCLFSMGIMAGMQVPEEKRKYVWIGSFAAFVLTYIPLMVKLFGIVMEDRRKT